MTQAGRDFVAIGLGHRSSAHSYGVARLAILCAGLLSGCMSGDVFQAENLPSHLLAPPVENAKTLLLTRLATDAPSYDVIGQDDLLEVTIVASLKTGDTKTFPVRVDKAGFISIPDVGEIPVAGMEPESAEAAIATAAMQRQVYRSPHVTVSMKKQATNRITVVGAVKDPKTYNVPRANCDLLSVLVAAGGLADDAGTNVEVRNPASTISAQPDRIAGGYAPGIMPTGYSQTTPAAVTRPAQTFRVDLVSATRDGTASQPLSDGAVVMVERRDPLPVYVTGLVNKSGDIEYPVSKPLSVLGAISEAGGVSNQLADKVYVIRQLPGQSQPELIQVSIRKAKRNGAANLRLAPGDIVSVEQNPGTVFLESIKLIRFGVGASLGTIF